MLLHRGSVFGVAFLGFAIATSGCSKNKPAPAEDQKSDHAPAVSASAAATKPTASTAASASAAPAEVIEPPSVKIIDPGAEPRAPRKYTFVPNKVDKRVFTMSRGASQSADGQPARDTVRPIPTTYHLELTAKQVTPKGATFDVKITKVESIGAPPQLAEMFAAMSGLMATVEVQAHGEVGVLLRIPSMMDEQHTQFANQTIESVGQGLQLLVVPLPEGPIGVGAKWEIPMRNAEGLKGQKRFTLKELKPEGGLVVVEAEMKVPRKKTQAPGGEGTVFVEVEGGGRISQELRFNQLSPKAEGELSTTEKVEIPDPSGGSQKLSETSKMKQSITTPAP